MMAPVGSAGNVIVLTVVKGPFDVNGLPVNLLTLVNGPNTVEDAASPCPTVTEAPSHKLKAVVVGTGIVALLATATEVEAVQLLPSVTVTVYVVGKSEVAMLPLWPLLHK